MTEQLRFCGYSIEELRQLVREGLASGSSNYPTLDEVKAEARRRVTDDQR